MTNKIRFALAAAALVACGSASANTVVTNINWGNITAPDAREVGNIFVNDGPEYDFSDRYNFTLTNNANSFGDVDTFDFFLSWTAIDLSSVSLWSGGSQIGYSAGEHNFHFENLGAGSYSLHIDGSIGYEWGLYPSPVGYTGGIVFKPRSAVPEPSTLALAGLGFLGLAFAMRRRLFNN